jgi:hypothetical protein
VIFLDVACNIFLISQFFFYQNGIVEFVTSKSQFTNDPYLLKEFNNITVKIAADKSEDVFWEWYERWIWPTSEVAFHYVLIKILLGLS